ncbi:MAG: winged helix-turn-helix transcriptional regulator [Chloroflexi bacterium]|nr:winged helix-turn-helix transcriptional regulator [Chloroflexota bacterium]
MAKRVYDQSCGLAAALDLLGERWTLLILRDLVLGPQRYTDLLAGLGGIGTNLLANRLHELEALGLVRKRELPPPAASMVYELSEEGRGLEPAMAALGRWGARHMTMPESLDALRPRLLLVGLLMSLTPEQAQALDGQRYELQVGGLPFRLWFEDGRPHARQEPAVRPDAVIEAPAEVLLAAAAKQLTLDEAIAAGAVTVEGDLGAARALFETLDITMVGAALDQRRPAESAAS